MLCFRNCISNLVFLLVLLEVCDTLSISSLLLMTNQMVFCQGEIITHFLQLLSKVLVFLQQRLSNKNKKTQVNIPKGCD